MLENILLQLVKAMCAEPYEAIRRH